METLLLIAAGSVAYRLVRWTVRLWVETNGGLEG